jgi:hypothetical protein
MDITVLNRGEKVAGIAGLLLILSMFIFDWFAVEADRFSAGGSGEPGAPSQGSAPPSTAP